ncbi:Down syndrome cell adhesion molecule-like protein 1 [Camponotus floridanus]|uniref:Down syndrome cell adhesion molecule-like protein 1 n=1 Tax=Camponotus floridanus TaxID=104421 RepID=E2B0P8_CAMFO|nr:Down syndrome cell adhesion molecule-like protein 1 [Camponotus floridanus]
MLVLVLVHFLEPTSSAKPKLPSIRKVDFMETKSHDAVNLMCPVQGYPVPISRAYPRRMGTDVVLACNAQGFPIPTASKAPAFAGDAKLSLLVRKANMDVSLPCNAQGHPPPISSLSEARRLPLPVKQRYLYWHGKRTQKSVFHAMLKAILLPSLEPMGIKAPAFIGDVKTFSIVRNRGSETSMLCNAQGHPVPVTRAKLLPILYNFVLRRAIQYLRLEPMGSKAPALTGDVKGVWMEKTTASNTVLPCPAQGYPVPSFRDEALTLGNLFISEPSGRTAPKTTGDGLNKYRGVEGESLALACAAQGFPAPITRWYKFIEGTSRRQPVQLNERVRQVSGTLIIREARVEDSGKYLCIVNNSVGGESVETVLTVTAPLNAEIEPSTQTIDFGRPATFTCTVQGNPIKTISWLKDGKPLGLEDRVLRIESVKKEDKGMYQCFVRNDQESAQATAELKLGGRFEPPQIRPAFAEETLQPGPSMFLKCVASGNPTPEITWELDGKRLSNTERLQVGQYVTVNGDVVSHLNISSIHTNDGGLYKCIAASKVGAAEHSARLNVYGLPFIRHMDKKAIVAGETLRVTCPVAGYPIESIVWERDTRVLPINRKQKVFPNGTLIIENVERMSDQATYTCVARNAQGYSARGTLEVQVMVPPIVQEFAFTKLPMNAGEFANLQCIVPAGDLPLNIHWSYPGEEMGGSSGVIAKKVADRVSMLMISVITARHAGEYVCTAENAAGTASHSTILTVNVGPQLLPIAFNAEIANWGDSVSVPCSILKGDMPMDISWAFNGVPIDTSKDTGITITKISKHLSTLSIDGVSARHAGEYACSASNLAGSVSRSTTLTVNVAPQIAPFTFGDEAANAGEMATVQCAVIKGDLPIDIIWSLNGRVIDTANGAFDEHNYDNSDIMISRSSKRASTLTIESVAARHAGEYSCTASNMAGTATHSSVLSVNVPPRIAPFEMADKAVNWGDSVSVVCTVVNGDSPLEITWALNGMPIEENHRISVTTTKRNSLLSIDSASPSHAGTYTCVASNAAGATTYSAELTVNVAPQIAPFEIAEEPANWGDSISVVCAILKGDLPIEITWALNGEPIRPDRSDINILATTRKNSILSIESVAARHAGEYTCSASNKAGATSHSTILAVNGTSRPRYFLFCWLLNLCIPSLLVIIRYYPLPLKPSMVNRGLQGVINRGLQGVINRKDVAPEIAPFVLSEKPANWGETVTATCTVLKGDQPIQIEWALNGQPISHDFSDITIATSKRVSLLTIDAVTASHAGEYTCVASNAAGGTSYSASLAVNVAPEIMPFVIGEEPANWGDTITVTCTVLKGDHPIQIGWALNGEPISRDHSDISIVSTSKRVSLLTIDAVTARHAGEYTCTASNVAGGTSYSASLAVNVAPHIGPFTISDGPANSGDMVSVTCSITKGDSPIKIAWKFNGHTINPHDSDITITKINKHMSALSIESVAARHAGEYTCVATNKAGNVSHSTTLAVNVAPQIFPFTFGDEPVNSGEAISATCSILKGDFPMDIAWAFNGEPISAESADQFSITKGKRLSVLSIDAVAARHAGEYTCTASNKAGASSHTAALAVNVAPQIAPFSISDEPANWGEAVSAVCTIVKGDLPIEVSWALNGEPITKENYADVSISSTSKRVSLITIETASPRHAGEYTCTASNAAGATSYSATLAVNGTTLHEPKYVAEIEKLSPLICLQAFLDEIVSFSSLAPQIAPFSISEEPANWGEQVSAVCSILKGDLPIEIRWSLNGELITRLTHPDITITNTGKKTSVLTIESVTARHAGEYSCVASNLVGSVSRSAILSVNVSPQIAPISFGEEPANAGDLVSVQCVVTKGDSPLEITWTFDGHPIQSYHSDVIVSDTGKRVKQLTIESVAARHAGEYTCVASNAAGSISHSVTLDVNVPPRWILEPTDKAFAQGSDARVECKADGFPKPQVTWKRAAGDTPGDYTDLKLSNPDISVEDGTLSINNIQKTNEGYYLCEAVNGIGSGLSAVILISVQAPPQFEIKLRNQTARRGEPAVLQCEAQGEKPIGILWNMNNKRLDTKSDSRYTIREEILANGVLSDLSIKRTERSDSALFTCVATNAFGSDDTSINMIVQEVPEVAYGLKVLDKSGRSVQLSWAAPYDGNSPIKRYVIEYKISKGSWETDIDRVLVPGSQQNVAGVYNLRPATTYHLRIVAENEIGTSDPSDMVTIITAEEAPTGPPTSVKVDALDQHTLKVTWKPPPREDWNGEILGYYVGYRQSADKPYMFETVEFSKEDGKEHHHLQIVNLKTYTQYGVVVQAFNKVGSGPMSEERRQHTAEGVPEQPPHDTTCTTLTSQTIRVSWMSPPLSAANGVITGYKVIYGPSDTWYDENTKDTKITSSSETILHGLKKYTNYSMQVLAFTSGGDGVKSAPIHCQTEQDAPEAPIAIKALVMSAESILISWRPPSQPNGVISQYTVYTKADNAEEPTSQKVPPNQLTHEASGLDKQLRYEFWVTASTNIGEGEASKIVTLAPSVRVPAKIASFDDKFTAIYKEDVKLPCLTVGVPAPEVTWKVRGATLQPSDRLRQLPEGSLFIKEVDRADTGEYSCYVENSFGHDTVTHQLVVHAPPHSPQVTLTATTTNSLTMKLRPHPTDNAPIHGYTIHYKPEFGEWETVQISSTAQKYTLENLLCGSRYQIYVTAYNGIGIGDPSDILNTRTKGSKPIIPEAARFIEVSTNSITLHLSAWSDGGCPMLYFVVEHKKKHQQEWNQVSNNVKIGGNFVVLDLDPASWYHLRVTAHNNAGFAVAEYEFATLTVTGGTIAPAREIPDVNGGGNDEDPMKIFMANLNLVVPVVAAILVIIVAVIVICVLRGKGHGSDKGTIAPPVRNGGNDNAADVRRYFPWLPSWLDVNVVVPVGATVVVIIVGIVVICVALSRRTRGPEQTRLRDDVVYQQTGVGGATLDKRRSDLRDELGYIAPPNRKLPPVPGSNYNTCDRIKRGTVISGTGSLRSHSTWDPRRHMYEELSRYAPNRRCPPPPRMGSADGLSHRGMEDEICPYATFHLLGFREEMDPSKAMQFQTFPHPGNGHSGTMGPPVGHPTNASAHSRSGSQSMPRQNGRYSRVPSQGGGSGTHNVFSPEYDDPANCAPEEDQYGSQYGQYGAPYDHYGSRGSVGRRSVGSARNIPMSGSPEPPPPPPRNHQDQNNSSFNDSKESNEISEAECDRDQLVNRNYGVNARGKDGMTTEEMRKLIERNEAPGRQTGSPHGGHGGLLTPYDTVAV